MKNIFCPTDFSETAQNAVTFAAKVAQKTGSQLTLFHVITFGELVPNELVWGRSVAVDTAQNYLDELCLEITRVFKISCEGEVEPSNLSIPLIIANESDRFDLIVMGTEGPDNFLKYVAGSNTYQVAHEIQHPLLLIPSHYEYQDITKVVCAFDYLNNHHTEFNQLITWAKLFHAQVTMLQVLPEEETHGEAEKLKLRSFQLMKLFDNRIPIKFSTIRSNEVVSGIQDYLDQNEVDALAVCSMQLPFIKKIFHRSVTKTLSADVKLPMFIFHN